MNNLEMCQKLVEILEGISQMLDAEVNRINEREGEIRQDERGKLYKKFNEGGCQMQDPILGQLSDGEIMAFFDYYPI